MTRALFDTVCDEYPSVSHRLYPDADIVMMPDFESGIIKIQQYPVAEMSEKEKVSIAVLSLSFDIFRGAEERRHSIVERATKLIRHSEEGAKRMYMDTRLLLPTSNMCEKLITITGNSLKSRQKGILTSNFESQFFLYVNREFWVLKDVHEIVDQIR